MDGDALTRPVVASLVLLDILLLLSLSGALTQAPSSMAICLACIFAHAFLSARWALRCIDQGSAKAFQIGFGSAFLSSSSR